MTPIMKASTSAPSVLKHSQFRIQLVEVQEVNKLFYIHEIDTFLLNLRVPEDKMLKVINAITGILGESHASIT